MEKIKKYFNVIYAFIMLKLRFILKKSITIGTINFLCGKIYIVLRKNGIINIGQRNKFNRDVSLNSSGYIEIGSRCEFKNNVDLQANGGKLIIHDGVFINSNTLIVACDKIEIGEGTAFGSGIKIYDHDHIFLADGCQPWNKQITDEVCIGKNCWIGSNVIILRGTKIGDNCIIGAGCIIKGIIPEKSKVIQKNETIITCIK